jgi:hypothetical protein
MIEPTPRRRPFVRQDNALHTDLPALDHCDQLRSTAQQFEDWVDELLRCSAALRVGAAMAVAVSAAVAHS